MDAKLLWERSVAVRNSFPVLVRLLEMDLNETETRLALEVAVERDTLDAPKWLPLDMVPSRHQWKMYAAFANLWKDLEDGQGKYLKLLERKHAAAIEALKKPPTSTDGNAQLLIQALVRQTELVIERDAARAEAEQFCESFGKLNEQQHRLVAENNDLSHEVRSIHNSVSQVDGGCAAGAPQSIHQRIYALGENLREAKQQPHAWREAIESCCFGAIPSPAAAKAAIEELKAKLGAAEARAAEWRAVIETQFRHHMTPAEAMAAIEQLKTDLKVAIEWAERRKRERDEALTTKTLPDVVRQFQQAAHQDMGDTFYCDQASRKKSEPGSLNALTADVLDWVMGLHDVLLVVDQNTVTRLQATAGALAMVPVVAAGRVQDEVKVDLYALADRLRKVFGEGEKS